MATITPLFAASSAVTITLASLGSSSSFSTGRSSAVVDNSTNLYDDALLSGKIRCGTTPVANTVIAVYVWGQMDDTPTYPDSVTGSDTSFSPSSTGVMSSYLKLIAPMSVDSTTSGRDYSFSGVSVAQMFGGILPQRWGVYVAQNTGVALDATGGNHTIKYQGVKFTVA